jgi:hypothetical protein
LIRREAFFTGARLGLALATVRFAALTALRVYHLSLLFSFVLLLASYAWP